MTNERPSKEEIFNAAAEIEDLVDRATFLDQACAGDQELRAEIENLLRHDRDAGSFLKSMGSPVLGATVIPTQAAESPGTVIGPYKLLQQIGEGGMGTVYMAEQSAPVQRKVALKIVKQGVGGKQAIARFEAERQALALMEHPNIAKVLDAGVTSSGRSYFVMELVKGVPITEYCDTHRLTPRERLELFLPVCQAVQHAHTKGLIHRDLKPSNVLVALYDGQPVPKVIDFGVAKAMGGKLTDATLFTEFGAIVGTLEYMSPEQAELNQLDVDTRSDIYSLGVLLYELLTGTTPLDRKRLNQVAVLELLRYIREEETPRPSIKLSTIDTLPSVAANRKIEPAKLAGLLRGELDWIVMKALEKDRNRRYETANGLAMDLQRYLHDEQVLACPPSRVYRLRKFARRNKAVLLTVAVVAATLVAGTFVSTWMAVRAVQAERFADANYRRSRRAVDEMYTQVAEKWLAHQPKLEPLQREFLQKALAFYTEFAKETSTDPAVRLETATAFRRVAEIQHKLGAPNEAEQSYRQAIDHLKALADELPSVPDYRQNLADALHKLGVLLGDMGRDNEEEQAHQHALVLQEKLAADFPTVVEHRRDLGRGHWFLGENLASLYRFRKAEQSFHAALEIQTRLVAEFPSVPLYREQLADSQLGFGCAVKQLGRPKEYRQALEDSCATLKKLVAEFPAVHEYRNKLAVNYYWLVDVLPPAEAEESLRKAIALQEKLADDFPAVTDYRYDLFRSYSRLGEKKGVAGRAEEAEQAYRRALAIGEKLAAESPTVRYYRSRLAEASNGMAWLLNKMGKLQEAEAAYRRSIDLYEKIIADFPDEILMPEMLVANFLAFGAFLEANGRLDEAKAYYRQALAANVKGAVNENELAWLLATHPDPEIRDPARAVELAKQAVELNPAHRAYWNTLGIAYYRAGNWKDAVTALEKSSKLSDGGHDSFDWFFLAMAHWQLGHKDEARKWYDQAVAWMDKNNPQDEELKRFQSEAAELLAVKPTPAPETKPDDKPAK